MRRSRHRFTPSPGACGEALAVPTGTPGVGPVPLPTTVSSASPRSSSTTAAASAAGEAMVSPPANDLGSLFARCTLNSRCDCNFSQHLRIWSVNVRKLLRRRAELEARLRNAGVHILLLQETWLSDSVEEIALQGYELVGRLDRVLGPKKGYGGVAIFVRSDISNVALLEHAENAERIWAILHTHVGAFLLGNWYRAPDEDGSSIDSLGSELERLRHDCVGVILIGDLNVHHRRWLRFSSQGNTTIGERLWSVCRDNSLKQVVKKPTRGDNLLDLVLTDASGLLKVQVLPEIADHRVVCVDLEVAVARTQPVPRLVWDFQRANWGGLKRMLKHTDWHCFLDQRGVIYSPDESVQNLCDFLVQTCEKHIPKKQVTAKARDHPWLDEKCYAAIEAKCLATGANEFRARELECNAVLKTSFLAYQAELKSRILNLTKASKEWWRLNRELLNRKAKHGTIPPLKTSDGKWVLQPGEKADLLARTFREKSQLPPIAEETPADLQSDAGPVLMSEFLVIRKRWVLQILNELVVGKASGPDNLPVRIFKECAAELAIAIAVLVRFLLQKRHWPQIWRLHRIHPLFKKGAVSAATNYRGVHLTNVLSKVVERVVAHHLTPFFDRTGAYGMDQWAFRKKHSCRDLVTLLVCRWIWALDNGFKVAIYLSDIAGAFDRVDRDILVERLRRTGLSEAMIEFLCSYLAPRQAVVVVQGKESAPFTIQNQVFQGTVLGSPLWNVFFKPVDAPIQKKTFRGAKFADDLTAYKNYESSTSNDKIKTHLEDMQADAHAWGAANRVAFDAGKEHFCILHRADCFGENFKLLGTILDPKLLMEDEIRRIRKKAGPKIKAILGTRGYYSTGAMIQQFKSHVLCLLEASAGAIFHASQSHLDSLDRMQSHFVEALGLTENEAFLSFNLAPLKLRRDIAVLGLLHRVQLGEVHPDFQNLFPRENRPQVATRHAARRHGKQFQEISGSSHYFNHSVFGATKVYNVMPAYAVNVGDVGSFQSMLTKDARFQCKIGATNWIRMYCCRARSF